MATPPSPPRLTLGSAYFEQQYKRLKEKRDFERRYNQSLGQVFQTISVLVTGFSLIILIFSLLGPFERISISNGTQITPIGTFPFVPDGEVAIITMFLGLGLNGLGRKITPSVKPPNLTPEEDWFLKLFPALQKIEYYQAENAEVARLEAARLVRGVAKRIQKSIPVQVESTMIEKELVEPLESLVDVIASRLVPALASDDQIVFPKAVDSLYEVAKYLLKPDLSTCKTLSSELASLPVKAPQSTTHPKLKRYGILGFTLAILPILTYAIGRGIGATIDTAYLSAATVFGLVTAGIIVQLLLSRK